MPGIRRALPRTRTRDVTVYHDDGRVTRVMKTEKACSARVRVEVRVSISDGSKDDASRLTVEELEAIDRALDEIRAGYGALSRDRAAGLVRPTRPAAGPSGARTAPRRAPGGGGESGGRIA